MLRTPIRKFAAAGVAAGIIITGMTALAGGANAYGGEFGELLVHGPGTTYATGTGTIVSVETTAGAAASYTVEVKNLSASTEQYNLVVQTGSFACAPGCPTPPTSVSAGSLILTPLTAGPNGYFTAPIAPLKTAVYTVKVTIPAGTVPSGNIYTSVQLNDTAHNTISSVMLDTNETQTKGTSADDEFVSGASGQKPVGDSDTLATYVTNPSVKLGGTSVFTVKLQNDSTSSAQIPLLVEDASDCSTYFPITVKAGSVDVTGLALDGSYITPSLAAGKSVTLTATVKFAATPQNCTNPGDVWQFVAGTGLNVHRVFLVTNPLAS